jgi:hypothetical protein
MPRSGFEADGAASAMSPKNDSGSSWLDPMGSRTIDLDALLTPEQFAQWVGESELWVRRRLASLPGIKLNGSAPYLYSDVLFGTVFVGANGCPFPLPP